jgi:S1-C subfamily serine protease
MDKRSVRPSLGAAFTTIGNVSEMAKIYGGMPFLGALPDSPAEKAGLRWGDIVLAVNGLATPDCDAFVRARLVRERGATVRYVRNGVEAEVELAW